MAGLFGWLWRRRWGATGVVPTPATIPPSPTRLRITIVNTELDVVEYQPTQLAFTPVTTYLGYLAEDGFHMSTPLIFTQTETGELTLKLTGVDGTPENLATASQVKLTVQSVNGGTPIVNAVSLTSGSADGTAIWTRLTAQVATAGDYLAQVRVVRSDGSIGLFPDGQIGNPLTILRAVGS